MNYRMKDVGGIIPEYNKKLIRSDLVVASKNMNCCSKMMATDSRAANERIVIPVQKVRGSKFQIEMRTICS